MMKCAALLLVLLFAAAPAGAAISADNHATSSGPVTQSPAAGSSAGGNLYLFLSNRKLHCGHDNMEPDGDLRDCVLSVNLEVDGPVRYEGNVPVGCSVKFRLHYLRAYQPVMNTVSRTVSVHVKDGSGKTVAKLPARQTGTLHSIVGNKLLKVDVDKLTCEIDSKN